MPVNQLGGPTVLETIQQSFNPAVAVLASPDVDIVCNKNRLTFVELLQPFSRLSVEGQISVSQQGFHTVNNLRLSVRDITWKPASTVLARRLFSDAVTNHNYAEAKTIISNGLDTIEINPHTPWYDSWRETLWGCLEWTEHDLTRHYLATLLVVSSSHPNPLEQFHQLNDQLTQLMSSNGLNDGPRWFNHASLRYYVLLHDASEGDASKAEEVFQSMRTQYGTHGCHLLVINSKPKRSIAADSGLPAPDPWLRFLPRKSIRTDVSLENESSSDALDNGATDLPSVIIEGSGSQSGDQKIPLMDALQEAMQEINIQSILPPSASTLALSLLASEDQSAKLGTNERHTTEIAVDPLNVKSVPSKPQFSVGLNESEGALLGSGSNDSELHGACLTADDLDHIQSLINEFCLKALLPHMERQMRFLNDTTLSSRKTTRSLLNATKRWFGGSKPGAQSPQTIAYNYSSDSPQLQVRRFGDLAFLLGLYDLAYTSYHSVKKDFENDQAWLHYAGALEMAALSVFLQGGGMNTQSRSIPFHYFDTALNLYLHTCKMPQWATRCAVLASECLKTLNQHSEAALQLIKLISEDADLRSAVLLEQAALCFLRSAIKPGNNASVRPNTVPLIRKYAFHMILAGHRFGKSGQKRHAARAYQLAFQVYRGHGWSLAEDHMNYTIGRQCLSNQQIEAACESFGALLKQGSMQTAAQQTAYLNEFIHVHQLMAKNNRDAKALPILPLPIVDDNQIKVLVETRDPLECNAQPGVVEAVSVNFSDDEAHHSKWILMEEQLVLSANKSLPLLFRPSNILFTETTNNIFHPQSFCDELISLEVPVSNPMRIPIYLSDIRLLWNFSGVDGNLSSTTAAIDNPLVTTYATAGIILNLSSSNKIHLHIKPRAEGKLVIEGMSFFLRPAQAEPTTPGATIASMAGRIMFNVRGPRLNTNQQERQNVVYAPDKRLDIQVGPRMPKLNVVFHSFPEFLLSGEIRCVKVELSSSSPSLPLGKILVATNDPRIITMGLPREERSTEDGIAIYRWDPFLKNTKMWVRGPEEPGLTAVDLMFYYDSPTVSSKYRLFRHSSKIFVSSSLNLTAWVQQVPSRQDRTPTLSLQVQVQNLRDIDDTSLSGIELKQVSLLNDEWEVQRELSCVPEDTLHPQESIFCVLLANLSSKAKKTQSIVLKPNRNRPIELNDEPYSSLIKTFRRTPNEILLVISWTATQASEDGYGTVSINGQHYLLKNIQDFESVSRPVGKELSTLQHFITYSMEFEPTVDHDFTHQRMCVVPVMLYLHNCSQTEVCVSYTASYDSGKTPRSTQLYMPEAASPLMWLGRVEGKVMLKHTSDPIKLSVAVTRPGVYSLAQGLLIDVITSDESVKASSPKLEFTLIVNQKNV